jgi:hypothetical protein
MHPHAQGDEQDRMRWPFKLLLAAILTVPGYSLYILGLALSDGLGGVCSAKTFLCSFSYTALFYLVFYIMLTIFLGGLGLLCGGGVKSAAFSVLETYVVPKLRHALPIIMYLAVPLFFLHETAPFFEHNILYRYIENNYYAQFFLQIIFVSLIPVYTQYIDLVLSHIAKKSAESHNAL